MEEVIYPDKKLFTKMVWVFLTITGVIILFVALLHLIIVLTGGDPSPLPVFRTVCGILILLMWIISMPITTLWIRNLSYIIREDRVTIHKGILTQTQQNIPYRAVTDFILRRSLYDRALGIASIRVQTAGQSQTSSGYEGNMAGVLEFDRWHEFLREKIRSLEKSGEPLTPQEPVTGNETTMLSDILDEVREIRNHITKKD